jgi:hypothetical protein
MCGFVAGSLPPPLFRRSHHAFESDHSCPSYTDTMFLTGPCFLKRSATNALLK